MRVDDQHLQLWVIFGGNELLSSFATTPIPHHLRPWHLIYLSLCLSLPPRILDKRGQEPFTLKHTTVRTMKPPFLLFSLTLLLHL